MALDWTQTPFAQWVSNRLADPVGAKVKQAEDGLQDPNAQTNWVRGTLTDSGWSPEAAQQYSQIPVNFKQGSDMLATFPDGHAGSAAGLAYRDHVDLLDGSGRNTSTLPHEMVHEWDYAHPVPPAERLADMHQALADMGSEGNVDQWLGDRSADPHWGWLLGPLRTPDGNYGKDDPAHTTQYLSGSLGIPPERIPAWYRQKYMGYLDAPAQ